MSAHFKQPLDIYGKAVTKAVRKKDVENNPGGGVMDDPGITDRALVLEKNMTLHEWLDTVTPGYGDRYARLLYSRGMDDSGDIYNSLNMDKTFLEKAGVDKKAAQVIKLAVDYESDESDE